MGSTAAIGEQAGGFTIRSASYCGNFALETSQGGFHRGERQIIPISTHGPRAESIEDMWHVTLEITQRIGNDSGYLSLQPPSTTPHPIKPNRLIFLETEG